MAEVNLNAVNKIYPGEVKAVCDFTLKVAEQEFLVLVGPSGCGKSTTLRLIAGLEETTSGTISIGERIVNKLPPKDRDIAMVFQNYALYPHMTVFKNMAFGLKLHGMKKAEIKERVMAAAGILGIEDLLGRRPKALSGGQRQRVAVGRAIVRQPAVFLFDEPLSNLDAKLRAQMRVEISRLHARLGATMIYVTHDQTEAMTMGDRIVVMHEGVIQQVADPLTLYAAPANLFVAGFIGTPPMNFFAGRVRGENEAPVFVGASGFSLPLPRARQESLAAYRERPLTLGLRPEDIGAAGGEAGAAPCLRATVDVVEPLGPESFVHFSLGAGAGAERFVSRVDAHHKFSIGAEVELPVAIHKAHFFDPETGKRIA